MSAPVTQSTLHAAAVTYAARGWRVLPLTGKVPAIAGGRGCLDAACDPALIAAWWRHFPQANVGVATGVKSGFWVLDVDGDAGRASLEALEREHGPLPVTIRQVTGSGGEHVLFACDPTRPVRNRAGVRPDLDVRGDGGYVVVAPSLHPETGRTYRWRQDGHPLRQPLAAAPAWLLDLVTGSDRAAASSSVPSAKPIEDHWGPRPGYARAAIERACDAIKGAPIGCQEATLNAQAYSIGRLVASGNMPCDLALRLLEWAGSGMTNAAGRRPWSQSEIREKIARCFADAQHHPRAPEGRAA